MTPLEFAIARSVIYASLFDYPLTLDQLHQTLIEAESAPSEILAAYRASEWLQRIVDYGDDLFFPAGRDDLIAERRHREARSRAFLHHYRPVLRVIAALPFTRMVALSGGVAYLNLERGGDLDLFVVTRGRRVWTVAVGVLLATTLLRQRRGVRVNVVLADSHLALEERDLFTAHQLIHLRPLVGAEVLEDLVAANPFIRTFYPNGAKQRADAPIEWHGNRVVERLKSALEIALTLPSPLIEAACRRLYGWDLQRRSGSSPSRRRGSLQSAYLLQTRSQRHAVMERFDTAVARAWKRANRVDTLAVS